jgi:guanylate kinase
LEDLNAIWRKREKKLMSQCNRKLEKLRRQLSNAPEYDKFVAEEEIKRLKGDLNKAHKD